MSEEDRRIIVSRAGKEYGPYRREEAMVYLDAGSLLRTDTARFDGEHSWLSLATVLGIPAPPPPPPFVTGPPVQTEAGALQSAPNEALLRLFVGPNYEYYAHKWTALEAKRNKRWSWNWAAFVFGLGWLFYRKMYLTAWMVIGVGFLIVAFELAIGTRGMALDFIIAMTCGSLGNYLYQEHCQRKLRKIVCSGVADETKRLCIAREGGTNIAAGIIPAAIWLVFNLVGIVAVLL
jgi:hypothetical protein